MRRIGFSADSGAHGSRPLTTHSVEQNSVRTKACGRFFETLHHLVRFACRRHRERPTARRDKICDLLVLGVRRLQINLHLFRGYGRSRSANELDLRRHARGQSPDDQGGDHAECASPARSTPGFIGPAGPVNTPRITTIPTTRRLRTNRCSMNPHLLSQPIRRV